MVDMKVDKGLTRILELLSEKKTQSHIARELKISRQAVSKRINRMIAEGLISESEESTSTLKFYHVNQILTMSEKRLTKNRWDAIFDPHNYGIKFKLVPNGEGSFPKDRKVHKRNWDAFYLDRNMVEFELTTQSLIGYLGDRMKFVIKDSKDIKSIETTIHSIILQEAIKVCEEYGMKVDLNHPQVCRRELGVVDPQIEPNDLRVHAEKYKKVYPDKIEFKTEDSLKNFIDNRVVENGASEIMNVLGGLVYRDTMRFNMEIKVAQVLSKIEKNLSFLTRSKANNPARRPKQVIQNTLWGWFHHNKSSKRS